TGGGKSLTFILPSYGVNNGTTVVITPFMALQEDLYVRYTNTSIYSAIWVAGKVTVVSVVFIIPESFITKSF
ncbi:hypothetical protein B0T18DRAFT_328881, partial [Schizothecium vesticola]